MNMDAINDELRSYSEPHSDDAGESAEDRLVVTVRRQWNDYRTIDVPLGDLWGFHWRQVSGGVCQRLPRPFLHARMWCSSIPVGSDFPHSCLHGPPPHAILVCLCKKDNREVFRRLSELSGVPNGRAST